MLFNFTKSEVVKEFNIFDSKLILKRIRYKTDSYYELIYDNKSRDFKSLYDAVRYIKQLEFKLSIYLDSIEQHESVSNMPSSLTTQLYQVKQLKMLDTNYLDICECRIGNTVIGFSIIINDRIKYYSNNIKHIDDYIKDIYNVINDIIFDEIIINKIYRNQKCLL